MQIIEIIVVLILFLIVLQNLLGPIIVKQLQRIPARVKFRPLDQDLFMSQRDKEYHSLHAQLNEIGFDHIGSSVLSGGNTDSYFSLYYSENDGSCAMLANIAAKARTLTYVEFTQIYEDDSVLNVSNSTQVSAYPRMQDKLSLRFPDRGAPAELYQAFVSLKKALKNTANPLRFDKTKGLQYLEDHIARESDSLVIKRYCDKAVDADGNRRLTWKGAFLLTWKSLFPGRLMQQYRDKFYADKLLRKALR